VKIYNYSLLSSTNYQAEYLLATGSKPPFIVTSLEQFAGEGRHGEEYYCPEGGLWFTLVDRYCNQIGNKYSMLGAVILTELLQGINIKSDIKWPNDVLINRKKVAGIMSRIKTGLIMIGVGINTNINYLGSFSDIGTSVLLETKKEINNLQLLRKFEKQYEKAIVNNEVVIDSYRKKLVWVGSRVRVKTPDNQIIKGVFKGITDDGFALVDQTRIFDGQMRLC